uniref:Cap15 family cyclic dinucleotide receptor domain-containing protein n=1 Tax=Flavobacterium sp. TaxID=239 RepID=UPI00404A0A52
MKEFTFKYYPSRILLFLLCIVLTFIILIQVVFNSEATALNVALWIAGSSSMLALIFTLFNKLVLWDWVLKFLDIPKLQGKYEGELISSYHIDDDSSKPHVKKHVKMEIDQNLNGFIVKATFYNRKSDKDYTSETVSVSHNIVAIGNGNYTINYLYRNTGNKLQKEHLKVTLNNHEGFSTLEYNPKTKSLCGSYFNDSQERPSHGKLTLNKI